MATDNSFLALLARARQGDTRAAQQLFERYEGHIRRAVRTRLHGQPRLRRLLDSQDIRQDVMNSFFEGLQSGAFEIHKESDLLGLLTAMALRKLRGQWRKAGAAKRGGNKPLPTALEGDGPVSPAGETPSKALTRKEVAERQQQLLVRIRALLAKESQDCQAIFHLWFDEQLTWSEIASRLGGTAESNRQKYKRACQRIREQLGEKEAGDAWFLLE